MSKKLDDLYFGVTIWDFNKKKFVAYNLFQNSRIRWSVARYITRRGKDEYIDSLDEDQLLHYLFSDVWGRVEWEFRVGEMFGENEEKMDVYRFFVEPNKRLLLGMVKDVSVNSARNELKKLRQR